MDIPNLLLAVIWILVAPFAADSGIAPSTPERQPAGSVAPGPAPGSLYGYAEHLRLRTGLPDVSMEAPREFAIEMVCALGLVALALVDCDAAGMAGRQGPDVLVLPPASGTTREKSASGKSAPGGPDVLDLRRRSIEQRMHSI